MEFNPNESLIKAGNLIREGRTKSARAILLEILREDKENAQAWFMLSYTIPDLEKQIYAVQQALTYKPNSAKAQKRLADLTGALPSKLAGLAPAEEASAPDENIEDYSQPIFPKKAEEEVAENAEEVVETDPLDALRNSVDDYRQFQYQDSDPSFTPRVDEIQKDLQEKEKKSRVFGIRRSQFLLGAAVLVVIISIIALVMSNIRRELANTPLITKPTVTNTVVPTSEPVATEITGEPVTLPQPTNQLPTQTIQSSGGGTFATWNTFSIPGGITQEKMDLVTGQLLALIGAEITPDFQTYLISDLELQGLIYDFPKIAGFDQQVSSTSNLYQAIGLASPEDDFSALYANFWVDPNGTLAVPVDKAIAVFGYEFSDYQQYSYAQGVMQIVRQAQFPDAPIYSVDFPCYLPSEKCDIWNAVVKGEAAFTASQWAKVNMDAESYQVYEETNLKFTFTPISPPLTDLMDRLVKSPYQIGYDFAEAVFNSQGWAGLEAVYTNPPRSTSQILHPEKYLAGEDPIGVIATDLGDILDQDWSPIFKGSIGEWKTFLLLAHNPNPLLRLEVETAQRAAEGWAGDHTQVFTSTDGRDVILFHWIWETSGEQAQFEGILREHTSRMVGGLESQYNGVICEVSSIQTSCILSSAEETIWLLAPDLDTAQLILDNYSFSGE